MSNKRLIIKESELRNVVEDCVRTTNEDLDQEMKQWDVRSKDGIGRTLQAIRQIMNSIIAPETDENGQQSSPISQFEMAYIMDNIPPSRWAVGLAKTLENYDMLVFDDATRKCRPADGDDGKLAALVNRLLNTTFTECYVREDVFGGEEPAPEANPEEEAAKQSVVDQINKLRQSGRMFGFDMSDYQKSDGEDAGYFGLEYDPTTNKLYAGYVANAGSSREYEVDYELDQTLDYNLEGIYDTIVNGLMEQGYENVQG